MERFRSIWWLRFLENAVCLKSQKISAKIVLKSLFSSYINVQSEV